jgi:hypothetical protein
VLRVRNTEAEALLEQTREEYERALQGRNASYLCNLCLSHALVKDGRLKEMELALDQRHPTLKIGKSDVLQLLTREAAENEQQALRERIEEVEDQLKRSEDLLKENEIAGKRVHL